MTVVDLQVIPRSKSEGEGRAIGERGKARKLCAGVLMTAGGNKDSVPLWAL